MRTGRTLEKGPRDRYTLTLPPGKLGATLANDRVEAIGQRFDEIGQGRFGDGVVDLLVTGVRLGDRDIVAKTFIKEVRVLGDSAK